MFRSNSSNRTARFLHFRLIMGHLSLANEHRDFEHSQSPLHGIADMESDMMIDLSILSVKEFLKFVEFSTIRRFRHHVGGVAREAAEKRLEDRLRSDRFSVSEYPIDPRDGVLPNVARHLLGQPCRILRLELHIEALGVVALNEDLTI